MIPPASNASSVLSKIDDTAEKNVIRNTFLVFLHVLLLLAVGIKACAEIDLYAHFQCTLEKPLELKIYMFMVAVAILWSILARRVHWQELSIRFPHYEATIAIFIPLTILLQMAKLPYEFTFSFYLLALIIGFLIPAVEMKPSTRQELAPSTNRLLWLSLGLTLLLIIFFSKQPVFDLFSLGTPAIFYGTFLFLQIKEPRPWVGNTVAGVLLFIMIFLLHKEFTEPHHYSFYLGPTIEYLYGIARHPLVNIEAQYGGGVTVFLAGFFSIVGSASEKSLHFLLQGLTFLQYIVVFAVATRLCKSRNIGLIVMLCAFFFNIFSQGGIHFGYPSVGVLRFGFAYLILALVLSHSAVIQRWRVQLTCLVGAIAILWSFESFFYIVPPILLTQWAMGRSKKTVLWLVIWFVLLCTAYIAPPLLRGQEIDLWRYIEYTTIYAGGFYQIPLERQFAFWWVIVTVYAFVLIQQLVKRKPDEIMLFLAVYGIMLFTYYGGRAHPNNIFHVTIPFIILVFALLAQMRYPWKHFGICFFVSLLISAHRGDAEGPILSRLLESARGGTIFQQFSSLTADVKNAVFPPSCAHQYASILPYIESGKIALLAREGDEVRLYKCLHVSNTFHINPYRQTIVSPKAIVRMKDNIKTASNTFLLISDTMKTNATPDELDIIRFALQDFSPKPVTTVTLPGMKIEVYKRKPPVKPQSSATSICPVLQNT
jgi:hypothetical protein